MLLVHHLVGGGSSIDQLFLEPLQCWRDAWILVAQAFDQLHHEGLGELTVLFAVTEQSLLIRRQSIHSQQPVADEICLLALDATAHDAFRSAS